MSGNKIHAQRLSDWLLLDGDGTGTGIVVLMFKFDGSKQGPPAPEDTCEIPLTTIVLQLIEQVKTPPLILVEIFTGHGTHPILSVVSKPSPHGLQGPTFAPVGATVPGGQ